VDGDVEAAVRNVPGPTGVVATAGNVHVHATDTSWVFAIAGAAAAALSNSARLAITVAAAIAIDTMSNDVLADIEASKVATLTGDVDVNALSNGTITAIALGIAATVTGGSSGGGLSLNLAGSVAYNDIDNSATAQIGGSSVASGNDILVTATDSSEITAV